MEKRYTTDEAEKYLLEVFRLKRTAATLTTLRNRGRGPRYLAVGRNIFYPESALLEYGNGTTHYTRDSLDSQTLPGD